MKDFYDIWMLIKQFSLDPTELFPIIHNVLKSRGTEIKGIPIAFTKDFYASQEKMEKWKSFLNDHSLHEVALEDVILDLKNYFSTMYSSA